MRTIRHRLTTAQRTELEQAEARPCPPPPRGCGAEPGQPCRNLRTGLPLGRQLAHPHRRHFPVLPEQRVPDARERAAGPDR